MKDKFNMEVKGIIPFPEKKSKSSKIIETIAAKGYREKAEADKNPVFKAVISTNDVDRARDLMVPKGLMAENFIKNPILMLHHKHLHIPIGEILSLEIGDNEIAMNYHFGETDKAKEIEGLYERGEMKAFSVGFYPWMLTYKSEFTDADGKLEDEVTVALPDKTEETINIKELKTKPSYIIHGWELLEVSCVNVGCNQNALQKSFETEANGVVRKALDNVDGVKKDVLEGYLLDRVDSILTSIKTFEASLNEDMELDSVISKHDISVNDDILWDFNDAKEKLARWASSDDTGDKDKINWSKFSKGFAWFDVDKANAFSAYKLIHHNVVDGELVTVSKGVTSAMANLLDASNKGETSDEHKKEIYDHLVNHYSDDSLVPEFKEYSVDELKTIADGTFSKTEKIPTKQEDYETPEVIGSLLKASDFVTFEEKLFEVLEEFKLSFGARLGIIMEELKELNITTVVKDDPDVIPKITIEKDRFEKIVADLKAIQSFESE